MDKDELSVDGDEVRDGYLDLLQKMRCLKEDLFEDKCRLEELINTSNKLFKKIKTSSELKLDAKMTALSTKIACKRMEKDIELDDITSSTFVELFRKNLLNDFYRYAMRCNAGIRFLGCFSLGNHPEASNRKKLPVQRSKQHLPETRIPALITREKASTEEFDILMHIKEVVLERGRVEYFRLVINPQSFSKTIENIFYLSLSLRSGLIYIEWDDDEILYVTSKNSGRKGDLGHLAIEMTYDEYLAIVEKAGISETLIEC
ncbi:hypothetical protein EROM_081790 [Encephalitozoon romaleae SJ-2008]|uniref:Non-structural maintenance of chromosomes element 4 n=1 Tax=Encephalitozoon romaleae (strain SJ-2008) TaxID=1178016 RepID=I7AFS7_ENCRO|nr:hypothetical protein EROM_081790 [Encephalitozoon romaleae SJ-2008]AFN83595.1 hypothetical protein EROM_081790 [Encephalitozoon romaleae SJ-2008]